MEVKLLKDWAGNKKSDTINIEDASVLKKGFEIGLFENKKVKEPKTEK